MINWIRNAAREAFPASIAGAALFALTAGCSKAHAPVSQVNVEAAAPAPASAEETTSRWPASSIIYTLYPEIFSPQGSFAGVTAQLPRLRAMGVTIVWVMPVTPIGQAINGHPSVDSPYDVHDYYAINPKYGTGADLHTLISKAHMLGMKVILDEVLNHTAWDNALITQHPEYYVHSDGNKHNPASIKMAFNYSDVAQLDYTNPELRAYMTKMLLSWMTQYKVDGFRFDSANNPDGPGRLIPADFWQQLGQSLRQTKPDVLMLGEEETPDLALKPFALDYAWRMYDPAGHGALKNAADGGDASQVETAWQSQVKDFPAGMTHMSVQDDWDTPRDVNSFGGPAGAMAVAVFNFTDTGVPLIYNGMEIGNSAEAANPHSPIKWTSGDPRFPSFYHDLIALRQANPAFTSGTMTWLPNAASRQALTYVRTGGGSQFLVEINLTPTAASGRINAALGSGWKQVPVAGIQSGVAPALLPQVSLPPKSFALYQRPFHENTPAIAVQAAQSKTQAGGVQDDASDPAYAQGYKAGENGGTGFAPFKVVSTGLAGTFVYTATESEGNTGTPPPDTIDTSGKSFGLFAQSAGASITITRGFTAPFTAPSSTFSLDFVSGFNEDGTSGVALTTADGTAGSFVFHGGGTGVLFNGASTGIGFVPGASHLVYTLTSPTTYSLKVTGADNFTGTGTFKGPITGFQVQQTNSGSTKPDHNAYFDNLRVGHN
ncbi:MAG: alpha-amylase family glycosyl hydrolase [Janthinobacterium lividum]